MSILALILSLAVLPVGPLLCAAALDRRWLAITIDIAVVISVGGLVLVDILPHSFAAAGWPIMIPLLIGLLGPTVAERLLGRAELHTHRSVLLLAVSGLGLHAVTDGIALALGTAAGHTHWESLPVAIVLHRFPAGLVVWRLLRHEHGRGRAVGALLAIAAGTLAGFVMGEPLGEHLVDPAIGLFNALVAGSLLHVVVHHRGSAGHHHAGAGS